MGALKYKVKKLEWSPNFAYGIGLLTSDGAVSKDGRHIRFTSKDLELVTNFQKSFGIVCNIALRSRGQEPRKKYFVAEFSDVRFYKFLGKVGIYPAKSKTIGAVAVPEEHFGDFLRGLFDGDGTIYMYRDLRWPNSYGFKISFASASTTFIYWLKDNLSGLYGVKGIMRRGAGVWNLSYTKGDSKTLAKRIYYNKRALFLKRKYSKLLQALEIDKRFGAEYLQKHRMPR